MSGTYLSPADLDQESDTNNVWECWYCGSLNPGADESGQYILKCINCDGPRKLSELEMQQYQEPVFHWSHSPNGQFVVFSKEHGGTGNIVQRISELDSYRSRRQI